MTTRTATSDEIAAIEAAAARFEGAEPEEILRWAHRPLRRGPHARVLVRRHSGMVLMDMIERLAPGPRSSTSTQTTSSTRRTSWSSARSSAGRRRDRAGTRRTMTPEAQAAEHGEALWERSPTSAATSARWSRTTAPSTTRPPGSPACAATSRARPRPTPPLSPGTRSSAWRRSTRLSAGMRSRSWAYIFAHDLPYNPLHDQATRARLHQLHDAVAPGDDPRSGRWAGTGKIECGLHSD